MSNHRADCQAPPILQSRQQLRLPPASKKGGSSTNSIKADSTSSTNVVAKALSIELKESRFISLFNDNQQ